MNPRSADKDSRPAPARQTMTEHAAADDCLLIRGYVIPHTLVLQHEHEIIAPPRWLDAMARRR